MTPAVADDADPLGLVRRSDVLLRGNPHRVLCRIFVPGEEELIRGTSRAHELVDRCLRLTDEQVEETLDITLMRFEGRHRNLVDQFDTHFAAVVNLVPDPDALSLQRKRLIGAYLTQEYALEAAAYFNPSIVPHPDQEGVEDGWLRFVMSVRAVGEGHISTIVFRTGVLGPHGQVHVEPACDFATTRAKRYTVLRSRLVQQSAIEAGIDTADLQFILGMLPDKFTPEELYESLNLLNVSEAPPEHPGHISDRMQAIARNSYQVDFGDDTVLCERVLWPTAADERRGMEDARFVRFVEDDGSAIYRATYTGFDGTSVVSRLLETDDFQDFSSMGLTGRAVRNKGLALFPRKVGDHYLALSRWDRESNSIAHSEDGYHWNDVQNFHFATEPWELIHVGNCGSPLETPEGWLVLTHGAGPMRRYCISAVLLDLQDPTKVIGALPGPLLSPSHEERNGYVPNVVYSCGALIHHDTLFLPYGISDCMTGVATVDVPALMGKLVSTPRRATVIA